MWTHVCQATKRTGETCTKASRYAFWCFSFEAEKYDQATWVEVCETHQDRPGGIVSGWLDIRRAS
jgi:hypothetical protein